MGDTIKLGDIEVDVVQKDIKNLHLSVHPPHGKVSISAPLHMNINSIRAFVISKLGWIKKERKQIVEQIRETPREHIGQESHYVWGKRYLLKVIERNSPPEVEIQHNKLLLYVRPETNAPKRETILSQWYRNQIKEVVKDLIGKWEPLMDVHVEKLFVQKMKTQWGSCNPTSGNIRINTELGKKPPQCLEYVVVHEMVHLLEPTHNKNFVAHMDRLLPQWRNYKEELNCLPVSHQDWRY